MLKEACARAQQLDAPVVRVRPRLRPRLGLRPRLRVMVRVRRRVRSSSAHESRSQKPSS